MALRGKLYRSVEPITTILQRKKVSSLCTRFSFAFCKHLNKRSNHSFKQLALVLTNILNLLLYLHFLEINKA